MAPEMLVVEDEADIAYPLVRTLEREGYGVTWVDSGQKALAHLAEKSVDLMILDLGLPDIDGLDVCRRARDNGFQGGIMIVTARAGELDLVVGLDYGADDYLPKPFGLAELQARVRALLRRSQAQATAPVESDGTGLTLDAGARRVRVDGEEVALTTKEFDLLAALVRSRGNVVSRDHLMSEVWDTNWYGSTKTLDVTVGRLRNKLEEAGASDRITAVRGVGFRLDDGDAG